MQLLTNQYPPLSPSYVPFPWPTTSSYTEHKVRISPWLVQFGYSGCDSLPAYCEIWPYPIQTQDTLNNLCTDLGGTGFEPSLFLQQSVNPQKYRLEGKACQRVPQTSIVHPPREKWMTQYWGAN